MSDMAARVLQYDGVRENLANLEELRRKLASRLALMAVAVGAVAMWLALPRDPFPAMAFVFWVVLLGLGLTAHTLVGVHARLARHLLIWGLTVELLVAMILLPDPWLPFLGLMVILFGAMLVSGGELMVAIIVAAWTAWATHSGIRAYPLASLSWVLALGVVSAWLVVRTLYMTLDWAWTMQQQATEALEEARSHRAELTRAVKSLELYAGLLRRSQRELAFARRQAEKARRMKEQFAANISHELRTPLNLILGFSELMYLSPEVYGEMAWPPTLRRDVYHIYRSSRHLLEMIDDILDLSRLEMAGFTLNKEPTSLEELVRSTVEIAQDLFRGRSVKLEMKLAPDLPVLEIDRTRIRQVLLNLLKNAQRFTEAGTVRVTAHRQGNEVVISVSDSGRGIPADQLPYIFDEFYQVDRSLRRAHEGAGLGLSISKHFVEAHGGRIWAESEEGVGSTFSFALPLSTYEWPGPARYNQPAAESAALRERPCLLVVDADPRVANLVRRHVAGYEVISVEAETLPSAVHLYRPRAIVWNRLAANGQPSDFEQNLSVPIIECSLPSQSWLARELAVVACLGKPFTAQELLDQIQRLPGAHDLLIVDDDRGFVQLVRRMLEATGQDFSIRYAYDGAEALAQMRQRRPDLLLLDLIMPGVDGFQVLQEMRDTPELAHLPVILLTATSVIEDALSRHEGNMLIHRPQGLRPAEVLGCLQAVIEALQPQYDERALPEVSGEPEPAPALDTLPKAAARF